MKNLFSQHSKKQYNKGFTLVETLISVLILAACIGALTELVASGFFSVRYAKNQIIATNMMQESLEYIRNTRDTAVQQDGYTWSNWVHVYNAANCFKGACYVDPLTTTEGIPANISNVNVYPCTASSTCPSIYYFTDANFYGYPSFTYPFQNAVSNYPTIFKRSIVMTYGGADQDQTDQVVVTATVTWVDGATPRSVSQSLVIANWHP